MTKTKNTLDFILKKITPTDSEEKETEAIIDKVKEVTGKIIKPDGISLTIAGSYVRDTWLPNKKEFDLFLLFPEWYSRDDLEKKGLSIGKKIVNKLKGKYLIAYAEHPYVRATIEGFDVDIVPCFKVESATKIRSAVDRTPFHNKWLAKNLKKQQSQEVRLFKQFCKGQGIYGSDTKTQGLSGYLCELLIVHFGDFMKLIKEISQWKPGVFIDLEKYHPEPEDIMKRFKKDPLMVIDPVDLNRNVSAALSSSNFTKLVNSSKKFLKEPSQKFFFKTPRTFSLKELNSVMKKRETQIIVLNFKRADVIDDNMWPQLRKAAKRINNTLTDHDFEIMGFDVYANRKECYILFEFSVWKLPRIRRLRGPDIFSEKRVTEFKNKYQKLGKVWVDNEYWFAEVKREITQSEKKIEEFLRGQKAKLREKGIPSYVAGPISKKYIIIKGSGIQKFVKNNPEFAEFLHDYFEREMI
jgi:tRNA nucleotidyltransferase (CCA-adding enzyme)